MSDKETERCITEFADKNAPCCASCSWWRYANAAVGECIKSAPVSAAERVALLGIDSLSLNIGAGHVMTPRSHYCGDHKDNSA